MLSFITYISYQFLKQLFIIHNNSTSISIKNKLTFINVGDFAPGLCPILLDVFRRFFSQKGFEIYKIFQKYNLQEMFVITLSSCSR
jgi:hypothetical protein